MQGRSRIRFLCNIFRWDLLLTPTLTAATLAQAQALFPNIAIPFPNFTGTIGQALKPFPQYSGISDPWLDVGNSTYNSLRCRSPIASHRDSPSW